MSLPTKTDLQTLDYAFQGLPFVRVEAKSLTTTSMDYAFQGLPFVVANVSAVVASAKHRWFLCQ